ncbi:mtDNA inheritance, partitioning of the mitochondrial organelle [Tilletia horrida]|uniref:MtDNA inheritance, partitioning of the mitochondrial organelle n=1 Tax=Tilletia horrida TaxID=155126 RepID=A0AAN6GKN4_9BASI|nr:mtDNA inheritance, partitioning of the mitochondrial organelle [Tilletia horrida]KAK0544562.1 mtDNA inheritance, partitioning of the mitochondrial organelle [Tilletia horrida]KAK0560719.1 mtDNA inheritance, partitioning of the mitochondrial organelle [Tilletia horrida]
MQREQLFLTFGSFAAHVQTHFWNAQESYFDYGQESASVVSSLVDHDVCFRSGVGAHGEDTFLPRTLIFDVREEFGSLRNVNRLYDALIADGSGPEADVESRVQQLLGGEHGIATNWDAPMEVLYTTSAVVPHRYQRRLDEGEDDDDRSDLSATDDEGDEQPGPVASATPTAKSSKGTSQPASRERTGQRYWSDYARVLFHPRSLIRVGAGSASAWSGSSAGGSDTFLRSMDGMTNTQDSSETQQDDARQQFESYEQGHRLGKQLDKDQDIMDENVRWFAEESDSLQAFNITATTSDAFSGFSAQFSETLHDEYHKTDILTWATEWGSTVDVSGAKAGGKRKLVEQPLEMSAHEQRLARIRRMNQALSACYLSESASLYVPLSPPPILARPEQPKGAATAAAAAQVHVNPGADTVNRLLAATNQIRKLQWDSYLGKAKWNDMWHSAALLSAHIETSTLTSRLRTRQESIPQLTSRLNWRQNTRIGILGGCVPTPLLAEVRSDAVKEFDPIEAMLAARGLLAKSLSNNSRSASVNQPWTPEFGRKKVAETWVDLLPPSVTRRSTQKGSLDVRTKAFARSITARDGDAGAEIPTKAVMQAWSDLPSPLGTTQFIPLAYNVPTSHPQFFTNLTSGGRALPDPALAPTNKRVRTLPVVSSLSTGPDTARLLLSHRAFVQDVVRGHMPLSAYGIGSASAMGAGAASSEDNEGVIGGKDGLKEVIERFEELLQGYEGAEGLDEDDEDDGRGTDEEWEEGAGEEWDLDD